MITNGYFTVKSFISPVFSRQYHNFLNIKTCFKLNIVLMYDSKETFNFLPKICKYFRKFDLKNLNLRHLAEKIWTKCITQNKPHRIGYMKSEDDRKLLKYDDSFYESVMKIGYFAFICFISPVFSRQYHNFCKHQNMF